ncbi:MAG: hypothetical protein D6729_05455 [Deltaproteobacteria bacterium]|nr:MAG: hypothetical protein D6729_05455 [Deltaproteobacteria bacterium]
MGAGLFTGGEPGDFLVEELVLLGEVLHLGFESRNAGLQCSDVRPAGARQGRLGVGELRPQCRHLVGVHLLHLLQLARHAGEPLLALHHVAGELGDLRRQLVLPRLLVLEGALELVARRLDLVPVDLDLLECLLAELLLLGQLLPLLAELLVGARDLLLEGLDGRLGIGLGLVGLRAGVLERLLQRGQLGAQRLQLCFPGVRLTLGLGDLHLPLRDHRAKRLELRLARGHRLTHLAELLLEGGDARLGGGLPLGEALSLLTERLEVLLGRRERFAQRLRLTLGRLQRRLGLAELSLERHLLGAGGGEGLLLLRLGLGAGLLGLLPCFLQPGLRLGLHRGEARRALLFEGGDPGLRLLFGGRCRRPGLL